MKYKFQQNAAHHFHCWFVSCEHDLQNNRHSCVLIRAANWMVMVHCPGFIDKCTGLVWSGRAALSFHNLTKESDGVLLFRSRLSNLLYHSATHTSRVLLWYDWTISRKCCWKLHFHAARARASQREKENGVFFRRFVFWKDQKLGLIIITAGSLCQHTQVTYCGRFINTAILYEFAWEPRRTYNLRIRGLHLAIFTIPSTFSALDYVLALA